MLGPSACGKTTLLKLIAGLLRPDSGDVLYDNVDVKNLAPSERRIGMVFQNYALYPRFASRSVREFDGVAHEIEQHLGQRC